MKDKFISFYKTIEIPKIHSLLLVFFCYETMKTIRADAGWIVCVIVYALCYIAAQSFTSNFRKINMNLSKIWQVLLFFLLYLFFVFSLLGAALLESSGLNAFSLEHYLFLPMAIIWTFPLFLQILVWMDAVLSRSLPGETKFPLKWKILAFAALTVNYSLWVTAFNPCISTYDSAYLFNQAHVMGIESMLNWQPPFYAIALHFLLKICDSATFLIFVQCAAFSILIIRLLALLLKKGISKKMAVFLYLVLGFAFNNVIQMITLWKDIPYMLSLLWLTVVLADLIFTSGKISRKWYIEFFLSLVFTALFRQNGIVPAIAVAVFVTIFFIRRKKLLSLIPIAAFIMSLVIIEGPVYSFYKVQSVPGLKYIAMSNDIIGTYYDGCDSSDDVMTMLNAITNNDPDHWDFNSYYISTYNSAALKDYSVPEFLSVYIRTFFEHPSEMAGEFAKRNSEIWSITKPHNEIVGFVNELGEWHRVPEFEYSYPWRTRNALTNVFSFISNKLTANYVVYMIAWRTAVYLLAILFQFFFVVKKRKMLYLLPFVPILFNVLSLMAGSGWTDYRYYWPTAIMALFLMAYTRIVLAPGKEAVKLMAPKEAGPVDSSGTESPAIVRHNAYTYLQIRNR